MSIGALFLLFFGDKYSFFSFILKAVDILKICTFVSMKAEILNKYNIPVPRYTSYPPANLFSSLYGSAQYEADVLLSNSNGTDKLSFYIHIPFCNSLCLYCGCNKQVMPKEGDGVALYVDYLLKELELLSQKIDPLRKVYQIHFGGGSPTSISLNYIEKILEAIRSKFVIAPGAEVAIECHPGYLDEQAWKSLIDMGFTRMSIGIQDIDSKVLRQVKRTESKLPLHEIVSLLRSNGIEINIDLIYGLPLQTAESFGKTIEAVLDLRPDRVVTFSYAHVPWVHPIQKALERVGLPTPQEKAVMYSKALGVALERGYVQIGLDHFVLPTDALAMALQEGSLHRNFQGYCTKEITGQVYALGITGISQLYGSYAQNCKDILTYYSFLNRDTLPAVTGYSLTEEEQVIKEIITELMCNYRCNPVRILSDFGIDTDSLHTISFLKYDALKEMAEDGLCSVDEDTGEIVMEKSAHAFVRNVAACFDIHYNPKAPAGYSKPI